MAAVRTGWWTRNSLPWVKRSAAFQLAVTPQLGIAGAAGLGHASAALAVTPSIGMAGADHEVAQFGMSVSVALGMSSAGRSIADFGISVSPQLLAVGAGHTPVATGLVLTPSVGMEIAALNPGSPFGFSLAVTPSLGMAGAERYPADFGLSVTPELTLGTGGITPASVGLAVTPALGMDGSGHVPASIDLTVTPSLGMAGAEHYPAALGLSLSPTIGVDAAARYPGSIGMTVTPTLGMAAKATTTYSSFPTVPAGTVSVALNSGAGAVQATSNTLQEGNSAASNSGYYTAGVLPDAMATDLFAVEATVGGLSGAAGDRGVGPGVFSADGTVGVMTFWPASSGTAYIHSRSGGSFTQRASLGSQAANTGARIRLVPSVSAGVVTWTVYLDDVPTALTWTDSSHIVDLPGRHPAAVFRHQYNFAQYPSRGVAALTAADI